MSETPEVPDESAPPAARLSSRLEPSGGIQERGFEPILHELAELDLAVYRAIATTPTPHLDEPMRRLTGLADHSKLWLGVAAVMATVGGRHGPSRGHGRRRRPGRELVDRERAVEARGSPHPPRPRGRAGAAGTPGRDAGVDVVPVRSFGVGFCLRVRGRVGICRGWPCRSDCWPAGWPTRECTPACTTPAMWSSAP